MSRALTSQPGSGGPATPATQVVSVSVNGADVARGGQAQVQVGEDIRVAVTFRNASEGTVRMRAHVTNTDDSFLLGPGSLDAIPDDPGEDGVGGKTLAPGQQTGEVCPIAPLMSPRGVTLQLQAEAQWADDQGQYHVGDTWPFTLTSMPPPQQPRGPLGVPLGPVRAWLYPKLGVPIKTATPQPRDHKVF